MEAKSEQTRASHLMADHPPDQPIYPEAELAEALGMGREDMRDLRKKHLVEHTDWQKVNNRVLLTPQASERLKKEVAGLSPEKKENGALEAAGREQGVQELVVANVPQRNVRLLDARKKEGGDMVRVMVRNNRNFLPGMEIKAMPSGEWLDVFVLEGRCPRYRGRW